MKLFHFKFEKGAELMSSLETKLAEQNITQGAIVSLIGAVDECCISNMPRDNATEDILKEFFEPFEFSGSGEIIQGKPHIHCTLSGEGHQAMHGHLHWAKIHTWFVSVYVAF